MTMPKLFGSRLISLRFRDGLGLSRANKRSGKVDGDGDPSLDIFYVFYLRSHNSQMLWSILVLQTTVKMLSGADYYDQALKKLSEILKSFYFTLDGWHFCF